MEVTAIFDIGKTNKKIFLFDRDLNVLHQENIQIEEIEDDDGFPGDDLSQITAWMKETLAAFSEDGFNIKRLNFSAYGASLVHLDTEGNTVTPFYNYLKPFPEGIKLLFDEKHGSKTWSRQTASPKLYMLNSGLQIFWLKYHKPALFKDVKTILHLPQYFHFYFTGHVCLEYTSIGCHTGLWDFTKGEYHQWVFDENWNGLFPKLVSSHYTKRKDIHGNEVEVGVGIHDSSSALYPYLLFDDKPFILVSTGTWSIALNPFNTEPLTDEELEADCLLYLQPDGNPVKAARLFLGNEYRVQVDFLNAAFNKEKDFHQKMRFDKEYYLKWKDIRKPFFRFEGIRQKNPPLTGQITAFASFEEAYHRLIIELVQCQVEAILLSKGTSLVNRLYIDGGFAGNEVFMRVLASELSSFETMVCDAPLGSALGAVAVMAVASIDRDFLRKHLRIRKIGWENASR